MNLKLRMDKLTKGESTVKEEKAKERNLGHSTFRDLPEGESGDWEKVLVRQKTKYQRSLEKKVMREEGRVQSYQMLLRGR